MEAMDAPMPRTYKELRLWVERLNNQLTRIREINDAKKAAHDAIDASFASILAPHEEFAAMNLAGIKAYVETHLASIIRWHGRTPDLGAGQLKVTVSGKAVVVISEAELTQALLANGYEEHVRWEPRTDKTSLKSASLTGKLGRVVREAGAYVARHRTISLTFPSLDTTLRLSKQRYPFVKRNDPTA